LFMEVYGIVPRHKTSISSFQEWQTKPAVSTAKTCWALSCKLGRLTLGSPRGGRNCVGRIFPNESAADLLCGSGDSSKCAYCGIPGRLGRNPQSFVRNK